MKADFMNKSVGSNSILYLLSLVYTIVIYSYEPMRDNRGSNGRTSNSSTVIKPRENPALCSKNSFFCNSKWKLTWRYKAIQFHLREDDMSIHYVVNS